VWVSQTKHQKKQSKIKGTLKTDLNVHLPTKSDQIPALSKAGELALGQIKEARLQVVLVLWRKMVMVVMKKTQNRLWYLAVVHKEALPQTKRLFKNKRQYVVKFRTVGYV
jgi:hypothetical protein